ncbi:17_t:CDS:2 [Dentiscutata erythropus]|uniref:17_t:CDS:1 n=1 Tax=Dentiscutata erythropus TaxID=1348616 RepID=A0A9N9H821_9GLOM|nr:17_t:CDS:2 [Dentiscutata erythropus]
MFLKLSLSKLSSESKASSSSSFDSLKSIGSSPVSSVTITLNLSSLPKVNSNDDFNSILSLNKVTPQNDNLSLSATSPVFVPLEELKSSSSSIQLKNIVPDKIHNNVLPLIITPPVEIPLQLSNLNNPLSLVYFQAITSSSDASLFPNKNSLNNNIRIVFPFIAIPNLPMIFLEEDSDESSDSCFKWYTSAWKRKIPEYKYNENDSDADSEIDEIQRLIKLKKEKLKFPSTKCLNDLAGNVYFWEEEVKPDLHGYISKEISRRENFNLDTLNEEQDKQLQDFLKSYSALFAWEGHRLGCTNLIKYSINIENAFPIKHNPYWHSLAKKKIIKTEIDQILKEGTYITYPIQIENEEELQNQIL